MPPKKPRAKVPAKPRRKASRREDSASDTVSSISLSDVERDATPPPTAARGAGRTRTPARLPAKPPKKASRKRPRASEDLGSATEAESDDDSASVAAAKKKVTVSGEAAAPRAATSNTKRKLSSEPGTASSHRGEIKPSKVSKKTVAAAAPPAGSAGKVVAEQYLSTVALPGMLARALLSAKDALRVTVTAQGSVDERAEEDATAVAPAEDPPQDRDNSDEASDEEGPDTKVAANQSDEWRAEVRAAFPCVMDFIFRACHTASVDSGGGAEGLVASLEMLGFFCKLLNGNQPATPLLLACPSCRTAGFQHHDMSSLAEFLLMSRRCSTDNIMKMTTSELIAALDEPRRDTTPVAQKTSTNADANPAPISPTRWCSCGETHMSVLTLLSTAQTMPYGVGVRVELVLPVELSPCKLLAETLYEQKSRKVQEAVNAAHTEHFARQYQDRHGVHMPHRFTPKPPSARQLEDKAKAEAQQQAQLKTLKPSWALDALVKLHGDAQCFEKPASRAEEIQGATDHMLQTAQATSTTASHFRLSVRMKPKEAFLSNKASGIVNPLMAQSHLQAVAWLFLAMSTMATSASDTPLAGGASTRPPRKTAKPSSSSQLYLLEELEASTRAWRLEKNNTQLVVPKSVVDATTVATKAQEHNRDAYDSSYAACSHVFSRALYEETAPLDVPGLIRYAATQGTLGLLDDRETTVESLAPAALINATLKRHQLENVAWMLNREESPVAEMVEIPIFSPAYPDPAGAATTDAPVQIGSFFYCATTCEYHILRAECAANQSVFRSLRCAIRGGFLSDDVGLGKTLSVLSLCAADRASVDSETDDSSPGDRLRTFSPEAVQATGDEMALMGVVPRQWKVTPRPGVAAGEGPIFKAAASTCCQFVSHLFPGALSEEVWLPKHHLPRTTLVVVPLSIVGQWIEEVERFYPTATYVLFYGTKRTQFTIEDLARADFVITTYETLAVHLRKECDGSNQILTEWVRQEDARFCRSADTQRKWKACHPASLLDEVARYAAECVWPSAAPAAQAGPVLDLFNSVTLRHGGGLAPPPADPARGVPAAIVPSRGARKRQRAAAAHPNAVATLDWAMDVECASHLAVLHGPGNLVVDIDPLVQDNHVGGMEAVRAARARKQALPPALLDAVWHQFQQLSSVYPHTTQWPWVACGKVDIFEPWTCTLKDLTDWRRSYAVLYILKLAALYPPPLAVQRAIAAYVLLPCCSQPAAAYFKEMKAQHYAEELKAEETGHASIRVLDILFRRVVLDESQKCGANGLFFLLSGERRWAVSGTPIDNGNPKSMDGPLRFIGATSAARYVCRYSAYNTLGHGRVTHNGAVVVRFKERAALLQMAAEGKSLEALVAAIEQGGNIQDGAPYCLCSECVQNALLASVDKATREDITWLPAEYQQQLLTSRHPQRVTLFFCHIIAAILCRFVVRHERDEQMRRALALVPVQHREVPLPLSAAERGLYDPAAQAVSDLTQRWRRQGFFTAHIGRAQLWLQNLQRLTVHPALQLAIADHADPAAAGRGGAAPQPATATLTDLIVRRVVMDIMPNAATAVVSANQEELEKALQASFLNMTAAEAVTWAESEVLRLRLGMPASSAQGQQRRGARNAATGSIQVFPEETLDILKKLAEVPPELPTCGVCMDLMAEPTVLTCYHLFCKQCVVDLVESSRNTMTRNIHAKCPYCRDANAMVNEKRVVHPEFHTDGASQAQMELEAAVAEVATAVEEEEEATAEAGPPEEQLAARLQEVGPGSRVQGLLQLLEGQVWGTGGQQAPLQDNDGVLVFSKFPAALERVRTALCDGGYQPNIITGGVTLAQRRKIITALCRTTTTVDPTGDATPSTRHVPVSRGERKILLLTSRAANAGLNLTFANHVIFLEPNLNPALETQAIGRAHRFGQTKQVYVYHLYAPNTVEDRLYAQSKRALALAEQARQKQQQARQHAPQDNAPQAPLAPVNQMRWEDIHDLLVNVPVQ